MSNVFQIVPLQKQSFLQKLLKQHPEDNAIIELNNLLATKQVKEISKTDLSKLSSKYKVNLLKFFPRNIEEFYAVYLNHYLKDKILSKEESENLTHLKLILGLNDQAVKKLHDEIAGLVYKKSIEEAIADGRLDEKEKEFLEKLKSEVQLDESIAKKISEETRGKFIKDYLEKAISDKLLSPKEEEELSLIAKSLNVEIATDKKTQQYLDKLKVFWAIENKELPAIDVDVNLQKNEICYYEDFVEWHEERRGYWTQIDSGNLYLTNKRVLFMGESKNTNIRLEKILSVTIHSDGVEIDKDIVLPFL
ncbi:MAG: hypothetical protein K2X86_15745 [Cytophagaceae bacterium]|nr:hypothetical protein [Cytophagaceae bacterium]